MDPQNSPVTRYQQSLSSYKTPLSTFYGYQVLKRLHRTKNSTVYMVMTDDRTTRLAVKVVNKAASSPTQLSEVAAEQRTLVKVSESAQHTRLIRSWHDTHHFYFIMSYYPETLAETLSGQTFDIGRARAYAAAILTAVKHLHDKFIVHRDLTPYNIFFREDGQVVLGGFRKCIILKPDPVDGTPNHITELTPLVASDALEYFSPERLDSQAYSFEVDLWSFGVLLFKMMVGHLPFMSNTIHGLRNTVRQDEVPLTVYKALDPTAQDLISRLLHKDLKERLTNIVEIQKHAFFNFIDWSAINERRTISPWKPVISSNPVLSHPPHFTQINPGLQYKCREGLRDPHPTFKFENSSPACPTTEALYPLAYRNLPARPLSGSRPKSRCVSGDLAVSSPLSTDGGSEQIAKKRSMVRISVAPGLGITSM
ncbi:hypothetical protein ONZ45_g2823 [Pleurotus djamor]|nr:hypothetical protein ONZ45_g2823 [Pleurotus djamor]